MKQFKEGDIVVWADLDPNFKSSVRHHYQGQLKVEMHVFDGLVVYRNNRENYWEIEGSMNPFILYERKIEFELEDV